MGKPSSAAARIRVTDDEISGLRIEIVGPRRLGTLALLAAFCAGWAWLEGGTLWVFVRGAPRALVSGQTLFVWLLTIVWLATWSLAGFFVARALLRVFRRREIVSFEDGRLLLRREPSSGRSDRAFDLSNVRDLRYAPPPYDPFLDTPFNMRLYQWLGIERRSIALFADGETHHFGIALDESDSRRLIATIGARVELDKLTSVAAKSEPTIPQSQVWRRPERIHLHVKRPARWLSSRSAAPLFVVWLLLSLLGALYLLAGSQGRNIVIPPHFIAFWIVYGAAVAWPSLRSLFLSEAIEIGDQELSIQTSLLGFGRTRRFAAAKMRNLRYAPTTFAVYQRTRFQRLFGLSLGLESVAFDYLDRTVRFGQQLPEPEARALIREIQGRLGPALDRPEPLPVEDAAAAGAGLN
jgi:hypothetical protein